MRMTTAAINTYTLTHTFVHIKTILASRASFVKLHTTKVTPKQWVTATLTPLLLRHHISRSFTGRSVAMVATGNWRFSCLWICIFFSSSLNAMLDLSCFFPVPLASLGLLKCLISKHLHLISNESVSWIGQRLMSLICQQSWASASRTHSLPAAY